MAVTTSASMTCKLAGGGLVDNGEVGRGVVALAPHDQEQWVTYL